MARASVQEAPADGQIYVRTNKTWAKMPDTGVRVTYKDNTLIITK